MERIRAAAGTQVASRFFQSIGGIRFRVPRFQGEAHENNGIRPSPASAQEGSEDWIRRNVEEGDSTFSLSTAEGRTKGRDEALASALTACGRLLRGRSGRLLLLIGDRGMGKTTLLRAFERETRGYPFYLRAWASAAWEAWFERTAGCGPEAVREGIPLTAADFEATRAETLRTLDRDFYAEALDGATAAEIALLEVMAEKTAESGSETCSAADAATLLGKTEVELARQVTRMTKKGLIYRFAPGVLAFSAPLAGASILRQKTGR